MIQDITINPNDLLVTIDVSSLYTNIIHEEGLEAMEQWMITNNVPHQKANLIKTLGKLVLKNNYLNLMETFTYKNKEKQWAQEWYLIML